MPAIDKQRFRPPALPQITVGGFWRARIDAVRSNTAPVLYDRMVAAGTLDQVDADRPVPAELRIPVSHWGGTQQMFWDSDIGKIIEAYAYLLAGERDAELEKKADFLIGLLKKLQLPDGYLNSWFTRMRPGKRWTNLRDWHELYNAGHLLEGAVAYFQATGKRELLDIMERYLDHIRATFGPEQGKKRGYPGHEELELALMSLYRLTGDRKHLELASYFIDERGRQPHYFELEAAARGKEDGNGPGQTRDGTDSLGAMAPTSEAGNGPGQTHEYNQSHKPVREQDKVVGHSVRAMYLYSGMADVSMETGDDSLRAALDRLWDDLTQKRLYLTGGMGPSSENEGFTTDYDFPNESAYAETCAAVGLVFWARRMLGFGPDIRYADVMEQALYNGALSGISLDGGKFFYENPLESRGGCHRWEWHMCPCCPPNIARLIASIGSYIYGQADRALAVHLYCQSEGRFDIAGGRVTLTQETGYPFDGTVTMRITNDGAGKFALATRIPGWSEGASASLNGRPVDIAGASRNGYLTLDREWKTGDVLVLDIPLKPRIIHPHPEIRQDAGRVALACGPLVYCLEGADNGFSLNRVRIDPDAALTGVFRADLLGGVTVLRARAQVADTADWQGVLYRSGKAGTTEKEITAIPYFAWDNRAPGEMLVWLPTR